MNAERLLTPKEAAERLGLSPVTVGHMLRRGELPGLKVGRLWRFREADLDEYIRQLSDAGAANRATQQRKDKGRDEDLDAYMRELEDGWGAERQRQRQAKEKGKGAANRDGLT
jgi:excisionase family DNA binding protein